MKKLLFLCCAGVLCASDLIGVDSLFKQQSGIRSITSLSLLSTGNPNSYRIYPNISVEGADYVVEDTKVLSLRQTLIYTLIKDLDILTSFGGNYRREEVFDFNTFSYTGNNLFSFNSWWIGLMYSAPKVFDFVPQITVQTSIIEREKILDEKRISMCIRNPSRLLYGVIATRLSILSMPRLTTTSNASLMAAESCMAMESTLVLMPRSFLAPSFLLMLGLNNESKHRKRLMAIKPQVGALFQLYLWV